MHFTQTDSSYTFLCDSQNACWGLTVSDRYAIWYTSVGVDMNTHRNAHNNVKKCLYTNNKMMFFPQRIVKIKQWIGLEKRKSIFFATSLFFVASADADKHRIGLPIYTRQMVLLHIVYSLFVRWLLTNHFTSPFSFSLSLSSSLA